MPKPLSQDLRARVVGAYEGGKETLEAVALMFQIGVATLVRLLGLKRRTGSLEPKPHSGGQKPKLSEGDLELLKALVKDRPDATQAELAEALERKVHKGVHARMVSRALERIGYSRKKTPHPVEQETERVQQARVEYWCKAKQIDPSRFVFVDESGSKCVMTPRYGWGPVGERVDGIYPATWGESITLLGAMGLDGIRAIMTVNGGTTGDVFAAFVEQLLLPRLRPQDVVVCDGLSCHSDSRVLQLLAQAHVKLLPLPPYSPDLNPIESCWSKIKHWVCKLQPRSRDQLDAAVAHAMKRVSPDDAHGWYAEAG